MIVRPAGTALHLITQPDHAHLARDIMDHCAPLAGLERRDAVLRAVGEHDNGWAEEDAAPTINPRTGAISDFINAPLSVRHRVWPRAIARLADDPWVAALVAQHAISVYDRFHHAPDWAQFFGDLASMRDQMVRRADLPIDDLLSDYRFVRLGDLISLLFCMGVPGESTFDLWSVRFDGTDVRVTPDLFAGVRIPIEIVATQIRNARFRSDTELRDALCQAERVTIRAEVRGLD